VRACVCVCLCARLGWLIITVRAYLAGLNWVLEACTERGIEYLTNNTLYNYLLIETWLRKLWQAFM